MPFRTLSCIFCALLGFQISAIQADCAIESSRIAASYRISESDSSHTRELGLWRLDNQVIHQRPGTGISDHWRWQRDGRVSHIRYFDHFQRGVTLPAKSANWSAKAQLLPDEALAKMQRVESSGESCKRTEKYERALKNGYLQVWWNPDLQLPVLLNRDNSGRSTTLKLTGFDTSLPRINSFFNQRYQYELLTVEELFETDDTDFIDAVVRSGISVNDRNDR